MAVYFTAQTLFSLLSFLLLSNLLHVTFAESSDTNNQGLQVGAARVQINPPLNSTWLPLDEYELENLHVRAIVFASQGQVGALISCELSNIEESTYQAAVKQVAATLNTTASNIIISSTHTHGAAEAGTGLFFTPENYGYYAVGKYASLGDALVDAVEQARARLEPAMVGYETGSINLNVNRDGINPLSGRWSQIANYSAPVDHEVQVLSFVRPNGSAIASYTSYAMHPIESYLCGYVSADWPGAFSRWIEKSFGDDMVAMYSQQASGDVNPRWRRTASNALGSMSYVPVTGYELLQETVEEPLRDRYIPLQRSDIRYVRQLFDEMTALGTVLGEEVIQLMSYTSQYNSNPRIWSAQRNVTCPGRKRLDKAREGVPGVYTNGSDVDIRTGALALGDIILVTVGAEIYTKIGWRIKAGIPMKNTMLVTMSNGKAPSGYIPDADSWDHETFEVLGSMLMPGPCAEEKISESLIDFVTQYQSNFTL